MWYWFKEDHKAAMKAIHEEFDRERAIVALLSAAQNVVDSAACGDYILIEDCQINDLREAVEKARALFREKP